MTSDANYIFPTCVTITSVLENSNPNNQYTFYILTAPENDGMDGGVFSALEEKYSNLSIRYLFIDNDFFANVKLGTIPSIATYYRLQIVSLLQEYDKCIFLDGDIIVQEDIEILFDYDLKDNYIAAVRDMGMSCGKNPYYTGHATRIGLDTLDTYVNAGVMLFNLKLLRKDNITKIWQKEIDKHYPIDDQDILNVTCEGRKLILPAKYNVFNGFIKEDEFLYSTAYSDDEKNQIRNSEIAIIHYASAKDKPWRNPYTMLADTWYKYLDKLPENSWLAEKVEECYKTKEHFSICNIREKCAAAGNVYIYGFTTISQKLYDRLDCNNVRFFLDKDEKKNGQQYSGIMCQNPDSVFGNFGDNDIVVVVAKKRDAEIIRYLTDNHISKNQIINYKEKDEQFYKSLDKEKYEEELHEVYREVADILDMSFEAFKTKLLDDEFYYQHAEALKAYMLDLWYRKSEPLVSIVIPAYNAEKTIDKCLNSVHNQNYFNWECIVINDGSEDDTLSIIETWVKQDNRIKVYTQENGGMGAARNTGIDYASGEWITFVDSDDWLEYNYVYELLHAAQRNGADICKGNFNYVDAAKDDFATPAGIADEIDVLEYNIYLTPNMWGNIYKKSLFIETGLKMPNICMEDFAIYPLLLLYAKRVCGMSKSVLNYHINVGTSIMDNLENIQYLPHAVKHMVKEAKRLDLYDRYKTVLFNLVVAEYRGALSGRASQLSSERYDFYVEYFTNSLKENFSECMISFKPWVYGSYNLCRVLSHCDIDLIQPYRLVGDNLNHYFGFSSISSTILGSADYEYVNFIDNPMRKDMVYKELNKGLRTIESDMNDYLILDLLEERYDVMKLPNGSRITKIEEWKDYCGEHSVESFYDRYNSGKWKNDIELFVKILREKFLEKHIIIVENYLMEKYVTDGKACDWYNVESFNYKLREYYLYIESLLPSSPVVKLPEKLRYTDRKLKYGNAPCYMNEKAFAALASDIVLIMNER